MELETLAVNEEEGSIVDVVVGADSLFAIVLEVCLEALELSGNDLDDLVGSEAIELEAVEPFSEGVHFALIHKVDKGVPKVGVRFVVHGKIEKVKLIVESGLFDFCQ